MNSIREFLASKLWLAFFLHQLLVFALAFGFLNLVRSLSGRTIHGGREPVGLIDGIGLVLLSVGVVAFTIFYYRWLKGKDAKPLGIEISVRRFIEFLGGLAIGFVFAIAPYLLAVYNERLFVADGITAHFANFQIAQILAVAFFLLVVQSVTEETANRAFPMRLWRRRSLLFLIVVPSIFFALIHLANENFSAERIAILFLGGVIQSLAYLLTGNIWFTSGIHTGANAATFSVSGLWHAGAVAALVGQPAYSNWIAVVSMLVFLSVLFVFKIRRCDGKKSIA